MLAWLKQYALTHLFYIILIAVGIIAIRCWLAEHDARMLAEQTVKQSDAKVKDLQQQVIDTANQAAQKVRTVTKIVHDAQTPTQVVAAVPQLTDVPLNARVAPDMTNITVDPQALIKELGEAKQDAIALASCEQISALKDQQLEAKDSEIKALKKKPNFFHRVLSTAKVLGIGIGIGVVLGVHGI